MKNLIKLGVLLLFVAIAAWAQPAGVPPVPVRAVLDQTAIPAGGQAKLAFIFEVPERHHLTDIEYGLFYVNLRDTLDLTFDSLQFPTGVKYKGETAYQGDVIVLGGMSVAADAEPRMRTFPVTIGYQLCQEFGNEVCFLPEEKQIDVQIRVVPAETSVFPANEEVFGAGVAKPTSGIEPSRSGIEGRLIDALERGSWLAFLLVFLGGILTSFTPCVYPVIPITIGYIGARSAGNPLRGFGLSLVYVLGIAVVYSGLGLISAATGTLFGSISGSPWIMGGVAAIFVIMGFSMLGAFDIALPASWLARPIDLEDKLKTGSWIRKLSGPFLIGMVSGLVMAPCVGPVIVVLLAWVAKTQNLLLGWALLFVFSLGLGLLFLVIGTFSGAIQALPKAGGWMEGIKKGFGWILLGAALFLLRSMIPTGVYFFLWGALLVIFTVFSGAFDTLAESAGAGKRFWKAVLLILFLVGAINLYRGLVPASTVAPGHTVGVEWRINEEPEVLAEALSASKPVIIDVYADWCAACVELDEKTYVVPEVVQRLEGFGRLKLDFTRQSSWVEEMKRKYEITGMPTVIFLGASGDEMTRFTGFKSAGKFLALMDEYNL